jgi:translation elongation factor EF-Ts
MTEDDKLRIYQEAKKELDRLQEEERQASIEQQKRNQEINAAYAVITFLSKSLELPEVGERISKSNLNEDLKQELKEFNYPYDGTWQDKIKAVIKYVGKVIKISEMADIMTIEENKLGSVYTSQQISGVISNNTSKMAKAGMLGVYKSPKKEKGYYYGSPFWWDSNDLREEYLPEPKIKSLW